MRNRNIIEDIKRFYRDYTLVSWLILINAAVLIVAKSGFFFSIFTIYMTYFAGKLFKDFLNDSRLISTYIFGTLAGAAVYMLISPSDNGINFSQIAAASLLSGVFALLVALATYRPNLNMQLFLVGNVKFKYIAIGFVLVDLLSINPTNADVQLAHLGGIIYGFLSIYMFKVNRANTRKSFADFFKKKPKSRMYSTGYQNPVQNMKDEDWNKQKREKQAEIDKILDKISQNGYDSLSKSEKEMLFNFGKR